MRRSEEGLRPNAVRSAPTERAASATSQTDVGRAWQVDFALLWFCQAGMFFSLMAAVPYITLYVQELGVEDRTVAAAWTGVINGAALAVFAVMNVIWGAAADRWGLKGGLVRSVSLSTVGLLIGAFATRPEHLLAGRLLQSVGGGTNSATLAVAGALVPVSAMGMAMGLLQMAQSLGGGLGPAVGGVLGDLYGYRPVFLVSGVVSVAVVLTVVLFVREPDRPAQTGPREPFFAGVGYILRTPPLRGLMALIFLFQTAYHVLWAFIPLRVQQIVADPDLTGRWSGAALIADSIGVALSAVLAGWLVFRVGPWRLLVVTCLLAGLASAAQALTWQVELLVVLRFVIGLCGGASLAVIRTLLGVYTEPRRRAVAFGFNQGAFSAAWACGSFLGSGAIAVADLRGAILLSAIVFGLATLWSLRSPRPTALHSA